MASSEKKARVWGCVQSNYLRMTRSVLWNCPIMAEIRAVIANHIWEFCYSYDYGSILATSQQWASSQTARVNLSWVILIFQRVIIGRGIVLAFIVATAELYFTARIEIWLLASFVFYLLSCQSLSINHWCIWNCEKIIMTIIKKTICFEKRKKVEKIPRFVTFKIL